MLLLPDLKQYQTNCSLQQLPKENINNSCCVLLKIMQQFGHYAAESTMQDTAQMSMQDITYNITTRITAKSATTEQEVQSCFNFTHPTNSTKFFILYCTKYYEEY